MPTLPSPPVVLLFSLSALGPLLVACSDSVSGVDPADDLDDSGWYVEFEYTGARTGTFAASGRAEIDQSGRLTNEGSFVLGFVAPGGGGANGWWNVTAFQETEFPVGNIVLFEADGPPDTGDYDLLDEAVGLADFTVEVIDGDVQESEASTLHDFVSGTLVLTEVTQTTIAGTFQGEAWDLEEESNVLTIVNGRFLVPIVEGPTWAALETDAEARVLRSPAGRHAAPD